MLLTNTEFSILSWKFFINHCLGKKIGVCWPIHEDPVPQRHHNKKVQQPRYSVNCHQQYWKIPTLTSPQKTFLFLESGHRYGDIVWELQPKYIKDCCAKKCISYKWEGLERATWGPPNINHILWKKLKFVV